MCGGSIRVLQIRQSLRSSQIHMEACLCCLCKASTILSHTFALKVACKLLERNRWHLAARGPTAGPPPQPRAAYCQVHGCLVAPTSASCSLVCHNRLWPAWHTISGRYSMIQQPRSSVQSNHQVPQSSDLFSELERDCRHHPEPSCYSQGPVAPPELQGLLTIHGVVSPHSPLLQQGQDAWPRGAHATCKQHTTNAIWRLQDELPHLRMSKGLEQSMLPTPCIRSWAVVCDRGVLHVATQRDNP